MNRNGVSTCNGSRNARRRRRSVKFSQPPPRCNHHTAPASTPPIRHDLSLEHSAKHAHIPPGEHRLLLLERLQRHAHLTALRVGPRSLHQVGPRPLQLAQLDQGLPAAVERLGVARLQLERLLRSVERSLRTRGAAQLDVTRRQVEVRRQLELCNLRVERLRVLLVELLHVILVARDAVGLFVPGRRRKIVAAFEERIALLLELRLQLDGLRRAQPVRLGLRVEADHLQVDLDRHLPTHEKLSADTDRAQQRVFGTRSEARGGTATAAPGRGLEHELPRHSARPSPWADRRAGLPTARRTPILAHTRGGTSRRAASRAPLGRWRAARRPSPAQTAVVPRPSPPRPPRPRACARRTARSRANPHWAARRHPPRPTRCA
eukprot:6778017-Prymnesium_polylepis.1